MNADEGIANLEEIIFTVGVALPVENFKRFEAGRDFRRGRFALESQSVMSCLKIGFRCGTKMKALQEIFNELRRPNVRSLNANVGLCDGVKLLHGVLMLARRNDFMWLRF